MDRAKGKKHWKTVCGLAVGLGVAGTVCGAGVMFREELKIANSIRKVSEERNIYYMEVEGDYHFEEFLKAGGASSDAEVSSFLTECISHGFYQAEIKNEGPACSVISAKTAGNEHIWGRNFDWYGSVPIIVKCVPANGYASISTCDFQNITENPETLPESFGNRMLAIAAVYVPMDGINEAGLCVADLEVNEGGMLPVDTDKPDLTITTSIRLLLNHAATVEEAVALLRQYDIHASGGISHHLAISDASGASVSVEFADGKMEVVDTPCITNFNLANADTAAGGESAQKRYEKLCDAYVQKSGIMTETDVRDILLQVSQQEGQWTTQWSIVYSQETQTVHYTFDERDNISYHIGR